MFHTKTKSWNWTESLSNKKWVFWKLSLDARPPTSTKFTKKNQERSKKKERLFGRQKRNLGVVQEIVFLISVGLWILRWKIKLYLKKIQLVLKCTNPALAPFTVSIDQSFMLITLRREVSSIWVRLLMSSIVVISILTCTIMMGKKFSEYTPLVVSVEFGLMGVLVKLVKKSIFKFLIKMGQNWQKFKKETKIV